MLIFLAAALAGDESTPATTPAAESAPAAEAPAPAPAPSAPADAPKPVADAAPEPEPDADLELVPRVPRWNVQVNVSGVVFDSTSSVPIVSESGVTAVGGSVSYAVTPWLHPFVGFNAMRAGMSHGGPGLMEESESGDDEAYYYYDSPQLQTAYDQQQIALGARGELAVHPLVGLFVLGQGQLTLATLRFDDDQDVDDNLSQFEASGATGGVTGTAGLTAYAPTGGDLSVSFSAEVGYEWNAPLEIGEVATLDVSGVFLRFGAGVRF